MRRDLIIGIIFAIVLHVGVVWVSEATKSGPPERKKEVEKVVQLELKTLPPEETEPEESEETPEKIEFMPPMQQDLPQLVTPDSFVIPPQPPPPDSLKLSTGALSIPQGNLTAGFAKVFELKDLDTIPNPTLQVPPNYPADLKRKGVEGFVEVGFVVDENGLVVNARVLSSSQREFEQAALLAVSKWKFKPGKKGGKSVKTNMSVPINFKLNGNSK